MEVKLNIKQKDFDKAIIREIARQIIEDEYNQSGIEAHSWDNPARDVLRRNAEKVFQKDPTFQKDIRAEMKKQMKNKKLIQEIAKDLIKSKMRNYDD